MPRKSNITPGKAPTKQKIKLQSIQDAISTYFGGPNKNGVDVLREQTLTNGKTQHTFILQTTGPIQVERTATTDDIEPLKTLLEPLYGTTITINLKIHKFFLFSGRIIPPKQTIGMTSDQIDIIF